MHERLSGVSVYGGGPRQHYVFSGNNQRRRKLRSTTIVLAVILALLLSWVAHLTYLEIAQPATANAHATQQTSVEQTLEEGSELLAA